MDFYTQKNQLNQRKVNGTPTGVPVIGGAKKSSFAQYEDPTGQMNTWQLKFAAWYVKNRILLYRLAVAFLIVFSTITLLYSVLRILWIVIVEVPRDEKAIEQMAQFQDYQKIHSLFAPQSFLVDDIQVFSAGVDKYDVLVEVTNPNAKHMVYFDYYFLINDKETEKRQGFILPLQTKPFLESGLNDAYGINLKLENISFKRINAHIYPDPASYIAERNIFMLENFEFKSVLHPEGANANIIKFDLVNGSPFHYYDPDFVVVFKNGGGNVGAALVNLKNLESLQRRQVDLRSFANNLFMDDLEIFPSINFFEQGEYFEPVR